jgi:F-type H+-transporting ATP synthase subunit e
VLTRLHQVLRYSALGAGVLYGFYHQRTITASTKRAEAQREYEHKQELIRKAKDEYTKSRQPALSTPATGGGEFWRPKYRRRPAEAASGLVCESAADNRIVKQDPMSPNFDMEAFMNDLMQQKA